MRNQSAAIPIAQVIAFPGCENSNVATKKRGTKTAEPDYHNIGYEVGDALYNAIAHEATGMWVIEAIKGLVDGEDAWNRFMKGLALRTRMGARS